METWCIHKNCQLKHKSYFFHFTFKFHNYIFSNSTKKYLYNVAFKSSTPKQCTIDACHGTMFCSMIFIPLPTDDMIHTEHIVRLFSQKTTKIKIARFFFYFLTYSCHVQVIGIRDKTINSNSSDGGVTFNTHTHTHTKLQWKEWREAKIFILLLQKIIMKEVSLFSLWNNPLYVITKELLLLLLDYTHVFNGCF